MLEVMFLSEPWLCTYICRQDHCCSRVHASSYVVENTESTATVDLVDDGHTVCVYQTCPESVRLQACTKVNLKM